MNFFKLPKTTYTKVKAKTKAGFTLIEILVSLAIFAFVITSTTAALLVIVDANSKAQSLKLAMDNVNVAIENMSRSIRLGTEYSCGDNVSDCSIGSNYFRFKYQDGGIITYELKRKGTSAVGDPEYDVYTIYRSREYPAGSSRCPTSNACTYTDELTSVDVKLDASKKIFYLLGTSNTDYVQPRVVIVLQGIAAYGTPTETEFSLQTTVTQRVLDEKI